MGKINEMLNSKPVESIVDFLSVIIGEPLENITGILYADALRAKRIANTLKLEKKYKLKRSKEVQPTSLTFGYNLLEKASLEDDDDLLDKWANLLSNATDQNFDGRLRKIYINILDGLDPVDVKIFDDVNKFCLSRPEKYNTLVSIKNPNITNNESLYVLLSLGLITYGVSTMSGIRMSGASPTVFHGIESFRVTDLGISFYKAVTR